MAIRVGLDHRTTYRYDRTGDSPTIPVHTPLIFDIVDTWTDHATGGCSYHVAPPGGRHHETFRAMRFSGPITLAAFVKRNAKSTSYGRARHRTRS